MNDNLLFTESLEETISRLESKETLIQGILENPENADIETIFKAEREKNLELLSFLRALQRYEKTGLSPEKAEEIPRLYQEKTKALATCKITGRKAGTWIVDDGDSSDGTYAAFIEVHCSCCGESAGAESGEYGWYYGDPFPWHYCPECGADMKGESMDTIVNHITDVDFTGIKVPVISLYGPNQIEYPGKYVARIFDLTIPTNTVLIRDSEAELKRAVEKFRYHRGMHFFFRGAEDDVSLIGCWI